MGYLQNAAQYLPTTDDVVSHARAFHNASSQMAATTRSYGADATELVTEKTRAAIKGSQEAVKQFKTAANQNYLDAVKRYRRHVFQLPERKSNRRFSDDIPRQHVKFGSHVFEGMEFTAEAPKELIVNITGCKARTIHWKDQIDHWLGENRSQLVFNTRIPRRGTNFVEDNFQMVQWLLRDENSPVHKIAEEYDIPIKVVSSSFGGYLVTRSLAEQQSASELNETIDQFVFINPFLTAKSLNTDRWGSTLSRKLYLDGHAVRNAHLRNSDHLLDIFHAHIHRLKGEPLVWGSNGPPTHAQTSEMQYAADVLRATIKEKGFPDTAKSASTHFYLGKHDYMADRWAGECTAIDLNAECTVVDGWHALSHEGEHHIQNISAILDGKPEEIIQAAASVSPPTKALHAA